MTRKQWMSGEIPVIPYDIASVSRAPVRLDWSHPKEVGFTVSLLPKDGSSEKPQTFNITVKKYGAKWLVDYWAPYSPAAVPDTFNR